MCTELHEAKALINTLLPHYTTFLSELIGFNSTFGNEKSLQLWLEKKITALGFACATVYSRNDDASMNLIVSLEGQEPLVHKSLILNAHVDIAPIDDIKRWTKDPFSGLIEEGFLYGRGAQDDRAGITILVLLLEVLSTLQIPLKGSVIFQFVVEDETTGNGSKALVDAGYSADGVIICDGTWSERIIYAHLGQIWFDITVIGEPVAACVAQRGINPIYIAMEYIDALKKTFQDYNAEGYSFEGIENPFIFNVGSFHSGIWHGSVPSSAELMLQISFPPPFTPQEIAQKVREIAFLISERIVVKEGLLSTPSFKTNPNSALIKNLSTIIEKNSGKACLSVPVTGHCDMRHFPTQNICLYGPGGGKNAHGIDEYYMLDQMPIVAYNLLEFIVKWCNETR